MSLQDACHAAVWAEALRQLAVAAVTAAARPPVGGEPAGRLPSEAAASDAAAAPGPVPTLGRALHACVVGGMGIEAVALQRELSTSAAAAEASAVAAAALSDVGASWLVKGRPDGPEARPANGAGPSGSAPPAPAPVSVTVTSLHDNELPRTLAAQLAVACGLQTPGQFRAEVRGCRAHAWLVLVRTMHVRACGGKEEGGGRHGFVSGVF